MTSGLVTIDRIEAARARLLPYVGRAPIVETFSGLRLKAESLHRSGAFKLRGAFNSLLALSPAERRAGVIAPSSGNHAQAVACAASQLNIPATVVMPENSPQSKRDGCRRWGAELVIHGATSTDSSLWAEQASREQGLALIHPYESMQILEATGIIGLEILDELPDVATVYVPISGGGLIGGLAAAIKACNDKVRVIGVEPELANDAQRSFRAGKRVGLTPAETARTAADGLRVSILGELTWNHIRALVDDIETVSEREIEEAVRWTAREARLIAEPSGAVSVAAALRASSHDNLVAVVSGGNVDPAAYARLIDGARSETRD